LEKHFAMMFKFFLNLSSRVPPKNVFSPFLKLLLLSFSLLLLTTLGACVTAPPLPKVDLSAPGWTVREGQAIWRPRRQGPEIAGELLVATRADGSAFVQFTKTPFPFAIAQSSPAGWQIEFPPQNRRFAAPGSPPARIVWFQLAEAALGKPVGKGWTWRDSTNNWQLKNLSSGESLDGYFSQ
jgi:hypothetical protein